MMESEKSKIYHHQAGYPGLLIIEFQPRSKDLRNRRADGINSSSSSNPKAGKH